MRPKTTHKDLPSRHDIEVHIHNEFVDWLKTLKREILVSKRQSEDCLNFTSIHRKPLVGSLQRQMGGRQIIPKGRF
jgi:hypothetical protein